MSPILSNWTSWESRTLFYVNPFWLQKKQKKKKSHLKVGSHFTCWSKTKIYTTKPCWSKKRPGYNHVWHLHSFSLLTTITNAFDCCGLLSSKAFVPSCFCNNKTTWRHQLSLTFNEKQTSLWHRESQRL